jgi:hypothetical protein
MERTTAAPRRLMLARSLAWAVHTCGWLVLGAAGARHAPLSVGGLLPAALWLGLLAYTLQACRARRLTAGMVRLAWLLAALLLVASVLATSPSLLAVAWAAASAASTWTVRLLRSPGRSPVHEALLPAAAGVFAAGCFDLPWLLGSPAAATLISLDPLWVCAVGAALTLNRKPVRHACRWGALDEWRSLQGLDASVWRDTWAQANLPSRLSAAAMLPMMAGLPTLLTLCSPARGSALAVASLHLAAMVVPGACLGFGRHPLVHRAPALCATLLIAGGMALVTLPLFQGLMWATLLHTSAWSIAWAGALRTVNTDRDAAASSPSSLSAALVAAGGVLLLGWALSALGPNALWLAHLALALLALAWVVIGVALKRPRHEVRPR